MPITVTTPRGTLTRPASARSCPGVTGNGFFTPIVGGTVQAANLGATLVDAEPGTLLDPAGALVGLTISKRT